MAPGIEHSEIRWCQQDDVYVQGKEQCCKQVDEEGLEDKDGIWVGPVNGERTKVSHGQNTRKALAWIQVADGALTQKRCSWKGALESTACRLCAQGRRYGRVYGKEECQAETRSCLVPDSHPYNNTEWHRTPGMKDTLLMDVSKQEGVRDTTDMMKTNAVDGSLEGIPGKWAASGVSFVQFCF